MIRGSWRLARIALQLEAEMQVGWAIRERARLIREMEDAAWGRAMKG